jgi:hypothetical protein
LAFGGKQLDLQRQFHAAIIDKFCYLINFIKLGGGASSPWLKPGASAPNFGEFLRFTRRAGITGIRRGL